MGDLPGSVSNQSALAFLMLLGSITMPGRCSRIWRQLLLTPGGPWALATPSSRAVTARAKAMGGVVARAACADLNASRVALVSPCPKKRRGMGSRARVVIRADLVPDPKCRR